MLGSELISDILQLHSQTLETLEFSGASDCFGGLQTSQSQLESGHFEWLAAGTYVLGPPLNLGRCIKMRSPLDTTTSKRKAKVSAEELFHRGLLKVKEEALAMEISLTCSDIGTT